MGMRCKALFYLRRALQEGRFSPRTFKDTGAFLGTCGYVPRLLWAVAVHDFHAVVRMAKVFANFFGDHDLTGLAACATKGDGQIALAFVDVMRQQVDEQIGDARDELAGLRKRADVLGDARIAAG